MSTRFYYGQKDYIVQLNLMDDAFQGGPYSALPLAGGTMTGAVISSAGTALLPAVGIGASNTGLWKSATNQIGMSINGTNIATWSSSGLALVTALSIANGGTGSTTAPAALTALGGAKLNGDATQNFNVLSLNGGQLSGFRNKVINGDMRIDQRFNGAALVPVASNSYVLDRLLYVASAASKYNFQQNANSVVPPSGFTTCAGFVLATAFTPTSTDFLAAVYRVEGYDMQEFGWGSAGAKAATVSFWVRSGVTGAHSVAFVNSAFDRSYPTTFSIPVADTWTYITITIPGDTTGIWLKNNGVGLSMYFGLGMGSTFEGTNTSWNAGNKIRATGAVNPSAGTVGHLFALTGLTLELGSTATPFERRPYGTELALCQRYFCKTFPQTTAVANNAGNTGALFYGGNGVSMYHSIRWTYPVPMRAAPTITFYNPAAGTAGYWRETTGGSDLIPGVIAGGGDVGTHIALNNANLYTPTAGTAWYIHAAASAEL